jgi:uncharacterized protein involved in cysteine biosynthesis
VIIAVFVGRRPGLSRSLGFFDGLRAFFGGIGFIVTRPSMWGWAAIPAVVATLLFGGTGALAIWGGSALAQHVVTGVSGWATAGMWTLKVVFWLIGLLFAALVAFSLAQPIAGFALDVIARRQELALGGRVWPEQPFLRSVGRSIRVTFTALAFSVPLIAILSVITFLFPPAAVVTVPLKFLVAGCAIAYDFLDYPLGLRGAGVAGFLGDHFGAAVGFGLAAASVLLIPGIGLLLLPFGVAGATRMVVLADRGGTV